MKAFTDYPIVELCDAPGLPAPIREVEILYYDGNKYCEIRVEDITVEIKSGYLYHAPGRNGEVPYFMHDELMELPLTTLLNQMNEDELRKEVKLLQHARQVMRDERHRDYVRLRTKYEACEKNLKNNPDQCGGKERIEGHMSGLIDGMTLLNPNLKSVCMEISNEKS